jgi:hypothetical protein
MRPLLWSRARRLRRAERQTDGDDHDPAECDLQE